MKGGNKTFPIALLGAMNAIITLPVTPLCRQLQVETSQYFVFQLLCDSRGSILYNVTVVQLCQSIRTGISFSEGKRYNDIVHVRVLSSASPQSASSDFFSML